jgi:dolichol-phosphate mannosyltransferase
MAGVRAKSDGNPNTAELLPQEHPAAGPAEVAVGFLQPKALTIPSSAADFPEAPAEPTLVDTVQETIPRYPAAPALDDGTVLLIYKALGDRIAEVSLKLWSATIGARDRVGVRVQSSFTDLHIAFLNIRAAGSGYVFARSLHFFRQLASLRFGRMFRFAAVGAFGTVLNLAIMAVMLGLGSHYLLAAIVATELTILSNFLMQERLVFRHMRGGRPFWQRILASFGFNNIETLVRMPLLVPLVSVLLVPSLVAQAATLAVAFLIRFAFTSRVIYRIRPAASRPVLVASLREEQQS